MSYPTPELEPRTLNTGWWRQVAYPTDKSGAVHWPKETTSMDGKMGRDFMTNFMLKERLAIEKDFDEIAKPPNRRSWGGNSPLEVTDRTAPQTLNPKPSTAGGQGQRRPPRTLYSPAGPSP